MTEKTDANVINMTIDIKKAILQILERSHQSYTIWDKQIDNHPRYIREIHANNQAIRTILESIQ